MRKLLVLLVACAALVGCGPIAPIPTNSATPVLSPARMFWVADTGTSLRLFAEDVSLPKTGERGLTALRYLVAHKPVDPDYSTLWPAQTIVKQVAIVGDSATVDLSSVHLNVGSEAESIAVQQLLWTLFAAEPELTSMRITVDGRAVETLAGHLDATGPFTRPPAYEVVSPVWLLEPTEGARLSGGTVTLSGMACTFEANVAWSIKQDAKVVRSGSTTAAAACPDWSPWSVKIQGLAPGAYTAEAAHYSPKDGGLVAHDTKQFTLLG